MGLRESLRGSTFEIVGEAADAGGAVALALRARPELCLLDLDMPGGGIRAIHEILEHLPETAIVVLSASGSDTDLLTALRAGAVGFLPLDLDPTRLPDALHGVLEGEAAIPRSLVLRLVEAVRSDGRHREARRDGRRIELTWREWEVLDLMCAGLSTGETAARLLVSAVTVRRHVSNVVKKLDVADRTAAVALLDRACAPRAHSQA
jgi:DNA-binding NarL/FixJ family response regulator